jgi:hypothetical protein
MTVVRSIVLAAFVALAGCTEPSVLRPPHAEDQAIEQGRTPTRSSPAPDSPVLAAAPREELAGPERWSVRHAPRIASLSPEPVSPSAVTESSVPIGPDPSPNGPGHASSSLFRSSWSGARRESRSATSSPTRSRARDQPSRSWRSRHT